MVGEYFNQLKSKSLKLGLCASIGASSLISVSSTKDANATPVAAVRAADRLFTAKGNIKCEDNAAVTGVWVESTPTSGWATFIKLGNTSVYEYMKSTDDPLYTVHVGCGGTPNKWLQPDYSHIVSVGHEKSFLCYTRPNPDKIPFGRCILDPELNAIS